MKQTCISIVVVREDRELLVEKGLLMEWSRCFMHSLDLVKREIWVLEVMLFPMLHALLFKMAAL